MQPISEMIRARRADPRGTCAVYKSRDIPSTESGYEDGDINNYALDQADKAVDDALENGDFGDVHAALEDRSVVDSGEGFGTGNTTPTRDFFNNMKAEESRTKNNVTADRVSGRLPNFREEP